MFDSKNFIKLQQIHFNKLHIEAIVEAIIFCWPQQEYPIKFEWCSVDAWDYKPKSSNAICWQGQIILCFPP